MADEVGHALDGKTSDGWFVVGHSMGAKVALTIARRAEDGDQRYSGLRGLVLIAGSPPSPEPMDERKRSDMIASICGDAEERRTFSARFIADNVGIRLDPNAEAKAIADVLRGNPEAWVAWLQSGSREDWCERIGVLRTPALILSGSEDADLGPEGQTTLMAPHLANCTHVVLDGAGHLLPLERPGEVARHIANLIAQPSCTEARSLEIGPDYRALIESDRVNSRLRAALVEREEADDVDYRPKALDPLELAILRRVCSRVVPQSGPATLDFAARIDARLATGIGDGWRFAELPRDAEAYRLALRGLDRLACVEGGGSFVTRDDATQALLLERLKMGPRQDTDEKHRDLGGLDLKALSLWFEDMRADVVRIYLAHPATLARLGFSGIGAGGDDPASINGFGAIGIGDREPWEPASAGSR